MGIHIIRLSSMAEKYLAVLAMTIDMVLPSLAELPRHLLSTDITWRSIETRMSSMPNGFPKLPPLNYEVAALLTIFVLYGSLFLFHVRFTAPVYNASQRIGLQKRLATINFFVHICAGTSEVLRWHVRAALYDGLPIPDILDILLCLLQVGTSNKIAKYMRRGMPIMTSMLHHMEFCPSL